MLLDDLAFHLQSAGIGTIGTTIFKGSVPLDVPSVAVQDALVALIETPGLPPVRTLEQPPNRYTQPGVQILSRGVPYGYAAARQKAQDAWDVLDGLANVTLNGSFYLWITARQDPWPLKTDDMNRPWIVFEVLCARAG